MFGLHLIRSRQQLAGATRGGAATIGNFDGVHRGHRAMLARAGDRARKLGGPLTVVTFEPRPVDYFLGDEAPRRVCTFRDKCRLLAGAGVDQVLNLRFDQDLATMPAPDFVRELLVDGLGIEYLLVGDDFRYGHRRAGDVKTLAVEARRHGFELDVMPTVAHAGGRVSSTRIREQLERADVDGASELLGHRYAISGRVRYGQKLGRELGFPTANLVVPDNLALRDGVWVARVHGVGEQGRDAVVSLGRRPTVEGRRRLLEAHLLDFDKRIYRKHVEVFLYRHLREEIHFPDTDSLTRQMHEDTREAREWLAANPVDDDVSTTSGVIG